MTDESTNPLAELAAMSSARAGEKDALTDTAPVPPETMAAASAESGTRAILRDAIQKVMDEIAHHEREAKRHLQQAQELRKELRESVAFLQAGGQASKVAETGDERRAAKAAEPAAKAKARDGDDKGNRPVAKKGPAGKRK
jgi:hypothetical protein